MIEPLASATPFALTLAVDGLVGSGYFLFALGLLCSGLGLYFRSQSSKQKSSPQPAKKSKKGKGKKSKKNKKQSDAPPKQEAEGGSLIWGGLGFVLIGIGMVLAGLFR